MIIAGYHWSALICLRVNFQLSKQFSLVIGSYCQFFFCEMWDRSERHAEVWRIGDRVKLRGKAWYQEEMRDQPPELGTYFKLWCTPWSPSSWGCPRSLLDESPSWAAVYTRRTERCAAKLGKKPKSDHWTTPPPLLPHSLNLMVTCRLYTDTSKSCTFEQKAELHGRVRS